MFPNTGTRATCDHQGRRARMKVTHWSCAYWFAPMMQQERNCDSLCDRSYHLSVEAKTWPIARAAKLAPIAQRRFVVSMFPNTDTQATCDQQGRRARMRVGALELRLLVCTDDAART